VITLDGGIHQLGVNWTRELKCLAKGNQVLRATVTQKYMFTRLSLRQVDIASREF
jgi:uncharacterized protein YdiU (UPF0061 family)